MPAAIFFALFKASRYYSNLASPTPPPSIGKVLLIPGEVGLLGQLFGRDADYLQLLDQQRHKPALADQVQALRAFARDKRMVVIFLSQIDRSYNSSSKPCPDLEDLRLPNPLDVKIFSKTCFLHEGTVRLRSAS